MKHLFKIGIIFSIVAFLGCTPEKVAKSYHKNLIYTIDPSTDLCFASWKIGFNIGTMTNVPCTEKVLKMIEYQRTKN